MAFTSRSAATRYTQRHVRQTPNETPVARSICQFDPAGVHGRQSGAHGRRRSGGFTLSELMVAAAIVGIAAALALPATDSLFASQNIRKSASAVSSAFSYARGEAIRSGNIFIVFIRQDTQSNTLVDADGNTVDIQVVDDGQPGATLQNCLIDAGEVDLSLTVEDAVTFGVSNANAKAPGDEGPGTFTSGSTFVDAGGSAANWVLFRPEGTTIRFSADCTTGGIGSGAGGVYLTDGRRDSAVVLKPLGSTRMHSWGDQWTD